MPPDRQSSLVYHWHDLRGVRLFAVVTLLIGRLGSETVAAHQIINNLSGLVMVPLGLGMATSIRVGFKWRRESCSGEKPAVGHVHSAGFAIVSDHFADFWHDSDLTIYRATTGGWHCQ